MPDLVVSNLLQCYICLSHFLIFVSAAWRSSGGRRKTGFWWRVRRALSSTEGLTSKSTSEAVSQQSWVTIKESHPAQKGRGDGQTQESPLSPCVLLCSSICCSVTAKKEKGKKKKNHCFWNRNHAVRLQPDSAWDVLKALLLSIKMNNLY